MESTTQAILIVGGLMSLAISTRETPLSALTILQKGWTVEGGGVCLWT